MPKSRPATASRSWWIELRNQCIAHDAKPLTPQLLGRTYGTSASSAGGAGETDRRCLDNHLARAVPVAFRRREQWQFKNASNGPSTSKATSPHRQLPRNAAIPPLPTDMNLASQLLRCEIHFHSRAREQKSPATMAGLFHFDCLDELTQLHPRPQHRHRQYRRRRRHRHHLHRQPRLQLRSWRRGAGSWRAELRFPSPPRFP
jgi:hypothetical protein